MKVQYIAACHNQNPIFLAVRPNCWWGGDSSA